MTAPLDTTNLSLADFEQLLEKGRSLLRQGQALAALEPLRLALPLLLAHPTRQRLLAECRVEIGCALLQVARPDEALGHLEEALRLFEEIDGTERERALCLY